MLIRRDFVERDGEVVGQKNKLGQPNNHGRKVLATSIFRDETLISNPVWKVPAVLPTGDGGLEVASFTEYAGQDRHLHKQSSEIYTVLRGTMRVYLDDEGPFELGDLDELVVLPGTIHEIVQNKPGGGEVFDLLVRVHALNSFGAKDKFVQLEPGGPWRC